MRALVVEDNADTRRWLCSCVEAALPNVDIVDVGDVAGAHAAIDSAGFTLAVIDLGLPDGDGNDIVKALNQLPVKTPILVATINDDDKSLMDALKSGARGYILKDQDRDKVVSYMQSMVRGEVALSDAMTARLVDHFNAQGAAANENPLSPREQEVLGLIAKGYSVVDAAGLLGLTANTVKGYVKTLYSKLGVNSRAEATSEAIRRGFVDLS